MRFFKNLFICLTKWRLIPSKPEELIKAKAIIGLSFGHRGLDGPGTSNEAIADCIRAYRKKYNLTIILQWELAYLFPDQIPEENIIRPMRGKYMDVYAFMVRAKEICDKNGIRSILLIAHPDLMWRAGATANNMWLDVYTPPITNIPYDPKSHQIWTKHPILFWIRELPARFYYLISEKF